MRNKSQRLIGEVHGTCDREKHAKIQRKKAKNKKGCKGYLGYKKVVVFTIVLWPRKRGPVNNGTTRANQNNTA